MSYKTDNFLHVSAEDNPAAQTISTTYTELTGSKCEVKTIKSNSTLMYKYSFYAQGNEPLTSEEQTFWLHIKLQKSNDNFSSNIVDIPNCCINFSGDTKEIESNADYYYKTFTSFFIVENFDSKYLRLVARSYDTDHKAKLHRNYYYDSTNNVSGIYYNPSLIVAEL